MIIVEGADNVGKTTLIQQLLELDPKLQLLKRKRVNLDAGENMAESYLNMLLPKQGGSIRDLQLHGYSIVDRCLASECIYGKLFRGGCRMSLNEHMLILGVLRQYNAMVIHCDPPDTTILNSWKEREQLYADPLVIARAYRERMHEVFYPIPIYHYDWTHPSAAWMRGNLLSQHFHRQDELRYPTP